MPKENCVCARMTWTKRIQGPSSLFSMVLGGDLSRNYSPIPWQPGAPHPVYHNLLRHLNLWTPTRISQKNLILQVNPTVEFAEDSHKFP